MHSGSDKTATHFPGRLPCIASHALFSFLTALSAAYILKYQPCKTLKSPVEACASLLATLEPHTTPAMSETKGGGGVSTKEEVYYLGLFGCAEVYNKEHSKHQSKSQAMIRWLYKHNISNFSDRNTFSSSGCDVSLPTGKHSLTLKGNSTDFTHQSLFTGLGENPCTHEKVCKKPFELHREQCGG